VDNLDLEVKDLDGERFVEEIQRMEARKSFFYTLSGIGTLIHAFYSQRSSIDFR